MNFDIIDTATSETVNLVNNAVSNAVRNYELEHPLQLRSVCRSSGLTCIDKLSDNLSTKRLGLSRVCLSLGRN